MVLNEQSRYDSGKLSSSISVNAVDVYVTHKNALGLGTGSRIIVGHADSSFQHVPAFYLVGANAYGAYAYGKSATVTLTSGPAAYAGVGCTGGDMTSRVATFSVSKVGGTGTVVDHATASISTTGSSAHGQSKIQNLSLFSNLITAGAITADANATFTGHAGTHTASLTVANLKIAGVATGTAKANVRVNLAGLGYVIVNEQSGGTNPNGANATINALDIRVTVKNSAGIPIGTQIIVGHAHAEAAPFS